MSLFPTHVLTASRKSTPSTHGLLKERTLAKRKICLRKEQVKKHQAASLLLGEEQEPLKVVSYRKWAMVWAAPVFSDVAGVTRKRY